MAVLEWDTDVVTYGLDRGVLYLSDGSGVAWNGLVSVDNKIGTIDYAGLYFDGQRIGADQGDPQGFATLEAFTYPEEFEAYGGHGPSLPGLTSTQLSKQMFSLSYRSQILEDGVVVGYRIHILYNLIASPNQVTYKTSGGSLSPVLFGYDLVCAPEELRDFAPTGYAFIDTRYLSEPDILTLNEILYGSVSEDASLPPLQEFMDALSQIVIVDNGDGTWTATDESGLYITTPTADTFQITEVNAEFLDVDTYRVSST